MFTETLLPPPVSPPPPPVRALRVEYVDFQDVAEHREFRFRVRSLDGSTELRVRVAIASFGAGRVRLQDGPAVCYQRLLQTVAAGGVVDEEMITIDDAELTRYAEAHPTAPRHRSWSSSSPTANVAPPEHAATPSSTRRAAPVIAGPAPVLRGGQRVSHAVFGLGVMSAPTGLHTVVRFDEDGPKRFLTSMLEVHLLSAPHTWETTPRGKNRLCS